MAFPLGNRATLTLSVDAHAGIGLYFGDPSVGSASDSGGQRLYTLRAEGNQDLPWKAWNAFVADLRDH